MGDDIYDDLEAIRSQIEADGSSANVYAELADQHNYIPQEIQEAFGDAYNQDPALTEYLSDAGLTGHLEYNSDGNEIDSLGNEID